MIEEHEKFKIQDDNGDNHFFMEVNWNPDNKLTNECKVIKFTFPDGKKAFVKKEQLHAVLFAMGTPAEQQKMIPVKLTQVRHWKSDIYILMQKDMKKGQVLKAPVDITLPSVSEEVIGGFAKDMIKSGKLPKIDKECAPNMAALKAMKDKM